MSLGPVITYYVEFDELTIGKEAFYSPEEAMEHDGESEASTIIEIYNGHRIPLYKWLKEKQIWSAIN